MLGDAEYGNEPVITRVRQPQWVFVCHVHTRQVVRTTDDPAWQPIAELEDGSDLRAGQVRHREPICFTQAYRRPGLTLTLHWGQGEAEPLCLISNLPAAQQPHLVYERRFWIETLFGGCRARGFGLTRTHPEPIDSLILAIVFVTCMRLGLRTHRVLSQQPARVDRADRRDSSLLQLGWRWLHRFWALDRLQELKLVVSWRCTLPKPGFRPAT